MLEKCCLILLAVITVVPCYFKYKQIKQRFREQLLFHQRHNCVVMYASNKGMSGWPPYKQRVLPNLHEENCLDILYEPVIFFINTSTNTLDIAIMMISLPNIFEVLIQASKRGVKVRLMMNFEHVKSRANVIQKCIEEGIQVQPYITHNKPGSDSIMHYKYMLKDYKEDGGYVLIGSMNLTSSAFLDNYEDLVFTSEAYLAKQIHDNFEECWRYVKAENETLLNKTILLDANFL